MNNLIKTLILAVTLLCFSVPVYAEEEKAMSMPPAQVVVSEVKSGMIAPESEFIGTIFFVEVSDVACEVDGKVESVEFEEGQRMVEDAVLVRINSDLLLSDLEKAVLEFKRAEGLYKEDLIPEEDYDARRFEKERLEIVLSKKTIRAPFAGVIVTKHIDRGEWLSQGSVIATIAKDDIVDILVNAPESVVRHLKTGMEVNVVAGINRITGKIIALIPRGDLSTRTFPVKIRVKNEFSLLEGMGAKVSLPIDEKKKVFIVPRDAVMTVYGNTVVYTVNDSKAAMITVMVVGYDGMTAGIQGRGLIEGMQVVVKGNERIREGQEVAVQQ
jgi:RND family efflux transporter MFP subunit